MQQGWIGAGDHGVGDDLAERRAPQLSSLVLRHDDEGGCAVGDLRCVACGDRAAGLEAGPQPGERLGGGARPDAFVGVNHQRVALALGYRHGDDLVSEAAVLDGVRGPLVGLGGEGILRFASESFGAPVTLRREAHADVLQRTGEPVEHERVDGLLVAEAHAGPRVGEKVGRRGHRLHAAGDDDIGLAGGDHLVGLDDRVEARQADLVHDRRRDAQRNAGLDRGLASGKLSGAGQ